jgi:hypothetical protein
VWETADWTFGGLLAGCLKHLPETTVSDGELGEFPIDAVSSETIAWHGRAPAQFHWWAVTLRNEVAKEWIRLPPVVGAGRSIRHGDPYSAVT